MFRIRLLISLLFIFLIVACENDKSNEPDINACDPGDVAGAILDVQLKGSYTPAQVQGYLTSFGAPLGFTVDYPVSAYKVSYHSRDKFGELTPASGVMFIPMDMDTLKLISVQHGTVLTRDGVGSVNPFYAIDGLILAMSGYLVVEPDYLGLGDSQMLHPYLHAELSANAVIDMIRAARTYACENDLELSDKLFLAGYSEGGYATLATQKVIELEYAEEFELTAVAPLAGPFDLLGSTINMLQQESYDNPAYLAYLVAAYDDIYEWDRLAEVFQEPYASLLPDLFDGTRSGDEINAILPTQIDALFNPDFVADFLSGGEPEIRTALLENGFDNWGPIAPVKLIHGTADETVAFQNSETVYASMLANGAVQVELIPIQGGNHLSSALPAYFLAGEWFNSF